MDAGVIPLVEYFNSQGLTTIMSCEGHDSAFMSMFWIQFDDDVEQKDIENWMREHLDNRGNFVSCGHFVHRFYVATNGPVMALRYEAANKEAAMKDLELWTNE